MEQTRTEFFYIKIPLVLLRCAKKEDRRGCGKKSNPCLLQPLDRGKIRARWGEGCYGNIAFIQCDDIRLGIEVGLLGGLTYLLVDFGGGLLKFIGEINEIGRASCRERV